jgi:hypothetical protein
LGEKFGCCLPTPCFGRQRYWILDIGYWILDKNDYFKEQEPLNKKWANTIVGGEKSEDKKLKE